LKIGQHLTNLWARVGTFLTHGIQIPLAVYVIYKLWQILVNSPWQ